MRLTHYEPCRLRALRSHEESRVAIQLELFERLKAATSQLIEGLFGLLLVLHKVGYCKAIQLIGLVYELIKEELKSDSRLLALQQI